MKKLVVIRGGGELATGIAHRLHNTGFQVLMLEKAAPSAIRRDIVFAEAVYDLGITSIMPALKRAMPLDEAIKNSKILIEDAAERALRFISINL